MVGPRANTYLNRSTLSSTLKRPTMAIAAILVLLAAPIVSLMPAREAGAETFFGCNVVAGSPAIEDGEVVGKAEVECQTAWHDREITTEVWQRATDGNWERIEDSVTTWDGSDRVLPLHHPDTTGIWCAELSHDTRDFQTRIFIEDGSSHGQVAVGHYVRLSRDCLAASGVEIPSGGGLERANGSNPARDTLVTCPAKAYAPEKHGKDEVWAKTTFACADLMHTQVRYLRVSLVENAPGPIEKFVRNRAFADTSGLERTFTLITHCNVRSNQTTTYFNQSGEVLEQEGRFPIRDSFNSRDADVRARCK